VSGAAIVGAGISIPADHRDVFASRVGWALVEASERRGGLPPVALEVIPQDNHVARLEGYRVAMRHIWQDP